MQKRLRLTAFIFAIVALAGCGVVLQQPSNRVLIRTGKQVVSVPENGRNILPLAQGYAEAYVDYALLAEQTYFRDVYLRFNDVPRSSQPPYVLGKERYCFEAVTGRSGCGGEAELTKYAIARLNRWRLVYAASPDPNLACLRSGYACRLQLADAGIQIWARKGNVCEEIVIAFRGTQGGNLGEWSSNLRWLTRWNPNYDLYKQVQDNTPILIRMAKDEPCYRNGRTRLVAVGHSLGGGLAQQAAYRGANDNGAASPGGQFDRVVVFDPSPITGYYEINYHDRVTNSRGLRIERVYEDGEILAYLRFLFRQISPASKCDPQIVTVRFNVTQGSASDQHALAPLTSALLLWSENQKTNPQPRAPLPDPLPGDCKNKLDTTAWR